MRNYALFINGVYEEVLQDIVTVQEQLPEQILFLQPHSKDRIVWLADNPPSVNDSVRVFMSLTTDLPTVHFTGELVGWYDKDALTEDELMVMNRIIYIFQQTEPGIYLALNNKPIKNLLLVWRLRRLSQPFSVEELIKISDVFPVSPDRTTAGGYSYVKNPETAWLAKYL